MRSDNRFRPDHEFKLILAFECLEVLEAELFAFSAPRTLHIHNLHHGSRQLTHEAFPAGLHKNPLALGKKLLGQVPRPPPGEAAPPL